MIYTGVGPRDTPQDVLQLMMAIGKRMAELNWVLRSGGADGADKAFEVGCDLVEGPEGDIPSLEGIQWLEVSSIPGSENRELGGSGDSGQVPPEVGSSILRCDENAHQKRVPGTRTVSGHTKRSGDLLHEGR